MQIVHTNCTKDEILGKNPASDQTVFWGSFKSAKICRAWIGAKILHLLTSIVLKQIIWEPNKSMETTKMFSSSLQCLSEKDHR